MFDIVLQYVFFEPDSFYRMYLVQYMYKLYILGAITIFRHRSEITKSLGSGVRYSITVCVFEPDTILRMYLVRYMYKLYILGAITIFRHRSVITKLLGSGFRYNITVCF